MLPYAEDLPVWITMHRLQRAVRVMLRLRGWLCRARVRRADVDFAPGGVGHASALVDFAAHASAQTTGPVVAPIAAAPTDASTAASTTATSASIDTEIAAVPGDTGSAARSACATI